MKVHTRSYSGRGMYGKECLGVELNSERDIFQFSLELGVAIERYNIISCEDGRSDDPIIFPSLPLIDSMGLGIILYWPKVPFEN